MIRQKIARTNDYAQPCERYRTIEAWERDDLVSNLIDTISQATGEIQERMVAHLTKCDHELGQRVAKGLGVAVPETAAVPDDEAGYLLTSNEAERRVRVSSRADSLYIAR